VLLQDDAPLVICYLLAEAAWLRSFGRDAPSGWRTLFGCVSWESQARRVQSNDIVRWPKSQI